MKKVIQRPLKPAGKRFQILPAIHSRTAAATAYAELKLYSASCDDHCLGARKLNPGTKDKHELWYYGMAMRIVMEEMDWQRRRPSLDWIKLEPAGRVVNDFATALKLVELCKGIHGSEEVIELVDAANDTIKFSHGIRFNGVTREGRQDIIKQLNQSGLCNLDAADESLWSYSASVPAEPKIRS
jgi:hypothetical protein